MNPRKRAGFTLVELLVVIVILGVLIALLVPAVWGAVRRARQAQAESQVNILATALASFKTKYGDYPPSRLLFHESGRLGTLPTTDGRYFAGMPHAQESVFPAIGGRDDGPPNGSHEQVELRDKSIRVIRSLFPKVRVDGSSLADNATSLIDPAVPYGQGAFYDINGNGIADAEPILLDGHECLFLFLAGIPDWQGTPATGFALRGAGGFSIDPRNPFRPVPAEGPDASRTTPFYEVTSPGQLSDDDRDGVPGILDPIGSSSDARYVAYFSSTFGGYDPRDVRLEEGSVRLFSLFGSPDPVPVIGPNPWTTGPTVGQVPRWLRPQSFQLLSPGLDRTYGPGGPIEGQSGAYTYPGDDRTAEEDNVGLR